MECRCILDGFKMREDLTNLKNGLLEGRPVKKLIDSSIDRIIKTEIDCGVELDKVKTDINEIKFLSDTGRNLQALNKLDNLLDQDNKESIVKNLDKC